MGRIVVTEFVSLDGVVEAPGGGESFKHGGWSFEINRGDEGDRFKLDETLSSEALLLGRVTYEGFAAAWPAREGEFADKFNTMPKYVVSSTLDEPEWNNTTVLKGDVGEEVAKLKQEQDGDIVVHGSPRLVQTLLEHDLVDEIPADGLPGGARKRKAPLRRDDRQEAAAARRLEGGRRRRDHPRVPTRGRTETFKIGSTGYGSNSYFKGDGAMDYRRGSRGLKTLFALLALGAVVTVLNVMPAAGEVVPSEPPLATSSNVQLVGHIPGSAAGMTFKDHYAYVSGWGGITVLDIATADSPQVVTFLPLPHFENEDVDSCGNVLLVVNDREYRGPRLDHVRPQHREPGVSDDQRGPAARLDRQRARLRPHRELLQGRLLAGVGRRR